MQDRVATTARPQPLNEQVNPASNDETVDTDSGTTSSLLVTSLENCQIKCRGVEHSSRTMNLNECAILCMSPAPSTTPTPNSKCDDKTNAPSRSAADIIGFLNSNGFHIQAGTGKNNTVRNLNFNYGTAIYDQVHITKDVLDDVISNGNKNRENKVTVSLGGQKDLELVNVNKNTNNQG